MPTFQREELLILTKTYPQPSRTYRETTCVAAINRQGEMRRVFPIPFRFLEGNSQFRKWEWISANVIQTPKDQRPESRKLDVDTITKNNVVIGTQNGWVERRQWIEPHLLPSFAHLEARRQQSGQTLGILRPTRLIELEVRQVKDPEWTEDEKLRMMQEELFDAEPQTARPLLRKLPFDFHYRYECQTANGVEINRHKITDWEAGALYWNCVRSHGSEWEEPFRQKLETEFAAKDLMFLMGTMHRFPKQWLIVGLIYPPKPTSQAQMPLFS